MNDNILNWIGTTTGGGFSSSRSIPANEWEYETAHFYGDLSDVKSIAFIDPEDGELVIWHKIEKLPLTITGPNDEQEN